MCVTYAAEYLIFVVIQMARDTPIRSTLKCVNESFFKMFHKIFEYLDP